MIPHRAADRPQPRPVRSPFLPPTPAQALRSKRQTPSTAMKLVVVSTVPCRRPHDLDWGKADNVMGGERSSQQPAQQNLRDNEHHRQEEFAPVLQGPSA